MWCLGKEPKEDIEAIYSVQRAVDAGVIKNDCTVKWAEYGLFLTGKNIRVEFIDITSIKNIKERTPVLYEYVDENGKKHGHWVGVENGRIAFNSLKVSQCVLKGKPVTSRKIWIKK